MIKIQFLIDKIIDEITAKSKDYLPLIINVNARVENYFSILILGLLHKLKSEKVISNYEFQFLLNGNKRNHIDFFITKGIESCFIELKHIAIDNDVKLKSRRSLNFYTSFSKIGKKVGVIGDIDKLENLENSASSIKLSIAIITNPPSNQIIENKVIELRKERVNWKIEYLEVKQQKIGFIISKMM